LAVSSARGTTHIYAINPEGGPVNIHTHIPLEPIASHEAPFLFHFNQPKLLQLSVCARVKQTLPEDIIANSPTTSSAFVINNSVRSMEMFVITQTGILTQYQLTPHGPLHPSPDVDHKTLQLTVEPTFYWELGRRSSASQVLAPIKPNRKTQAETVETKASEPRWLSNVEIRTHATYDRPLCAGPQFTFKTFHAAQTGHSSSASFADLIADYTSPNENKIEFNYKPTALIFSGFGSTGSFSDLDTTIPTLPREREAVVKADINMAMSTPMEVPSQPTEKVTSSDSIIVSEMVVRDYIASIGNSTPSASSPSEKKTRDQGKYRSGSEGSIHLAPHPELTFYNGGSDHYFE
jgi:hypothetical protein